jgi:hypothetical protein
VKCRWSWKRRTIPQRIALAESLTVENIQATIRKYISADRHTVVTLMLETTPAASR